MSRCLPILLIVLAALVSLLALVTTSPDYLVALGFPLDDAWIHAVYARNVGLTGSLAFNPGIPATGATAPLWAWVTAIPYVFTDQLATLLVATKLVGFGLHVLTALLVYGALAERDADQLPRLVGALVVAAHPDLVAASVSGMEVPLAACAAAAILWAQRRAGWVVYAVLCAAAPLARPELATLSVIVPTLTWVGRDHRRLRTLLAGAVIGSGVSFGGLAWRNLLVAGLPLPATFYAKVGDSPFSVWVAERRGFMDLLTGIPVVDSSVIVTVLLGLAVYTVATQKPTAFHRTASAAFIAGMIFCAVSFALVAPLDADGFYFVRYMLPVLPLLIGPIPVLIDDLVLAHAPRLRWAVVVGICVFLGTSVAIDAPSRYARLANDARNIDDVQVAMGRSLSAASDHDVIWVTDAGAIRYFGKPFVVDMIGLNVPDLLGTQSQPYLDVHAPDYFEVVPGWSVLEAQSDAGFERQSFAATTSYTVTSFQPMRQQSLVLCTTGSGGTLVVRGRRFRFQCAPRASASSVVRRNS